MSSNNNDIDSRDEGSNDLSNRPITWAFIPLLAIFIVSTVFFIYLVRYRRRSQARRIIPAWPQNSNRRPDGRPRRTGGRGLRSSPWAGTRSQEGLNELGEAPPPYEGKQEGSSSDASHELRDLEAGNRPPEYIASPRPVATTDPNARRFVWS